MNQATKTTVRASPRIRTSTFAWRSESDADQAVPAPRLARVDPWQHLRAGEQLLYFPQTGQIIHSLPEAEALARQLLEATYAWAARTDFIPGVPRPWPAFVDGSPDPVDRLCQSCWSFRRDEPEPFCVRCLRAAGMLS